MNEVLSMTILISKNYPELYILLEETPLFPSKKENAIQSDDFIQYLESLKVLYASFNPKAKN